MRRIRSTAAFSGGAAPSALLLAWAGLGCGTSGTPPSVTAPSVFVATEASFCGFHEWSNGAATTENDAADGLHSVGTLSVYCNHSPPHGDITFPVGTIIVKETEQSDPTARTTFAMVKRGGGFNAAGAQGWEWFSLQDGAPGDDDCATILWRVAAPSSETYFGTPSGDCDGCHLQAGGNDSVWDSALQLSHF